MRLGTQSRTIRVNRREFILAGGALSGLVLNAEGLFAATSSTIEKPLLTIGQVPTAQIPWYCGVRTYRRPDTRLAEFKLDDWRLLVKRADDLLRLEVEFDGVKVVESFKTVRKWVRCGCFNCQRGRGVCLQCRRRSCGCGHWIESKVPSAWQIMPIQSSAYVRFGFEGQHVAEQRINSEEINCNGGQQPTAINVPIDSLLSSETRLSFRFGAPLTLSVAGLLDWAGLTPNVAPVAIPDIGLIKPGGDPVEPPTGFDAKPRDTSVNETRIVLPTGLVVSPHEYTTWKHQIDTGKAIHSDLQKPRSTTVEVWETSNQLSQEFRDANPLSDLSGRIRAIHSFETAAETKVEPIELSPVQRQRESIVNLNAGFHKPPYRPSPLICDDLRLSSLGGSIDARGEWPKDAPHRPDEFGDVLEYRHEIVQGRDQYVKVSEFLFGCPIPIEVVLIQETKREFIPVKNGRKSGSGAVLVTRWFSSHMPAKEFGGVPDGKLNYGRRWPFRSISFDWPDDIELNEPVDILNNALRGPAANAFWLTALCSKQPLTIDVTTFDRQGKTQNFSMPMMLIRPEIARDKRRVLPYLEEYYKNFSANREIKMGGQDVGFVPLSETKNPEDADRGLLPARKMWLNVEVNDENWHKSKFPLGVYKNKIPTGFPNGWQEVAYFPAVSEFEVRLQELDAYATEVGSSHSRVAWNPVYTSIGFDQGGGNSGELYVDLVDADGGAMTMSLGFSGDKGGGVVSPSLDIQSLSRSIGTVGGDAGSGAELLLDDGYSPNKFAGGSFDPTEFLPTEAKLIGNITLKDVLGVIDAVSDLGEVPQLGAEQFADIQDAIVQIQELRAFINRIADFATGLDPSILNSIDTIVNGFRGAAEAAIDKEFKAYLNSIRVDLELNDDAGRRLSFDRTFRILADSLKANYPKVDLNQSLVELKGLLSVDRLVREIVNEPWSIYQTELKKFNLARLVAANSQLGALTSIVRSEDELLGSSFFPKVKAILDLFASDRNDLEVTLRSSVSGFKSNLQSALNRSAEQIQRTIEVHTLGRIKSFFIDNFPKAVDRGHSPVAHFRLRAFEDYLDRHVHRRLRSVLDQLCVKVDSVLEASLPEADLSELLDDIDFAYSTIHAELTTALAELKEFVEQLDASIPRSISVNYDWETDLKDGPNGEPIFVASNGGGDRRAKLRFSAIVEKKLGFSKPELLSKPTAEASVELTDFQIVLVPSFTFLVVEFNSLTVKTNGFKKPDVDVQIENVRFGDSLEFVAALTELFSPGSGISIDIAPSGIIAGYSFAIPDFSLGMFNLFDLGLGLGLVLPFQDGPMRLSFNVSKRDRPCLLTVGVLGGAAFFRVEIEPNGNEPKKSLTALEAALEFGAVVAASIGVANGRLYVFGGVYYGRHGESVTLTGYVRAGGSLDVLGLITISAEFYLALEYKKTSDGRSLMYGVASISVRVKIIFVINVKVTITYRKEFKGSSADEKRSLAFASRSPTAPTPANHAPPKIAIPQSEWATYCRLFA